MGLNMILIEGPQGAGKTTLATSLSFELALPIYTYSEQLQSRGKYDITALIADVKQWGTKDFGIYQGHPFIEEYIYGPLFRREIGDAFYSWEIRPVIQFMWANSVIIYCRPRSYIDEQGALSAYDLLFRTPFLPIQVWEYDYTDEHNLDKVLVSVRAYQRSVGTVHRQNNMWTKRNSSSGLFGRLGLT